MFCVVGRRIHPSICFRGQKEAGLSCSVSETFKSLISVFCRVSHRDQWEGSIFSSKRNIKTSQILQQLFVIPAFGTIKQIEHDLFLNILRPFNDVLLQPNKSLTGHSWLIKWRDGGPLAYMSAESGKRPVT